MAFFSKLEHSFSILYSLKTVLSTLSCSLFVMVFVGLEQNIYTNGQ